MTVNNSNNPAVAPGGMTDNSSPVPPAVNPEPAGVGVNNPVKPTTPNASKNTPLVPAPTPQIGSGANDFFLFTQVRGALNANDELKNSAITFDIHAGAVTLNGTVASDEQSKNAARLMQGVAGVKSVKNQLRVSAAGGRK